MFDRENVDNTIETMFIAPTIRPSSATRRRQNAIAECDRKLSRYRPALDAGGDVVVIGGWITDVRADRAQAERMLAECATDKPTDAEVRAMAAWSASVPSHSRR